MTSYPGSGCLQLYGEAAEFAQRLASFQPQAWPRKPAELNPIACASRGWKIIGTDYLECTYCHTKLKFWCPDKAHGEVFARICAGFCKNLSDAHTNICPFRSKVVSTDILVFDTFPRHLIKQDVSQRASELALYATLPRIAPAFWTSLDTASVKLLLDVVACAPGAQSLAGPNDPPSKKQLLALDRACNLTKSESAILLALFGWEAAGTEKATVASPAAHSGLLKACDLSCRLCGATVMGTRPSTQPPPLSPAPSPAPVSAGAPHPSVPSPAPGSASNTNALPPVTPREVLEKIRHNIAGGSYTSPLDPPAQRTPGDTSSLPRSAASRSPGPFGQPRSQLEPVFGVAVLHTPTLGKRKSEHLTAQPPTPLPATHAAPSTPPPPAPTPTDTPSKRPRTTPAAAPHPTTPPPMSGAATPAAAAALPWGSAPASSNGRPSGSAASTSYGSGTTASAVLGSPAADEGMDPIARHRHWCPWVVPAPGSAAAGGDGSKAQCGWLQCVRVMDACADEPEAVNMSVEDVGRRLKAIADSFLARA